MRKAIIGAVLVLGACSSANSEAGRRPARERAQRATSRSAHSTRSRWKARTTSSSRSAARLRCARKAIREALERLDIRVENGALKIGSRRDGWFVRGHRGGVTVHVSVPSLDGASIAGSGDMRVDRGRGARPSTAEIAGSGDMEIGALRARRANFDDRRLGRHPRRRQRRRGRHRRSPARATPASMRSQTRRASVSVAGSGNVSLRATEAVEGSLMGSGNLTVHGSARCSVSKMGSGEVRCGGCGRRSQWMIRLGESGARTCYRPLTRSRAWFGHDQDPARSRLRSSSQPRRRRPPNAAIR